MTQVELVLRAREVEASAPWKQRVEELKAEANAYLVEKMQLAQESAMRLEWCAAAPVNAIAPLNVQMANPGFNALKLSRATNHAGCDKISAGS